MNHRDTTHKQVLKINQILASHSHNGYCKKCPEDELMLKIRHSKQLSSPGHANEMHEEIPGSSFYNKTFEQSQK